RRDEPGDVPQLLDELRGPADFLLRDPEVVPRVRLAGDERADRVRAVLPDQGPRVDDVAEGPVHRATAGVEAEAVDEHPVERLRAPDDPSFQRGIVEPGPDDLATLRPQGDGERLGEERRVLAVPREEEIRDARVHPRVEDPVLADERRRAALRAFVERRRVLPRTVVLPRRRRERLAALLAVPQRDLRMVVPPSG